MVTPRDVLAEAETEHATGRVPRVGANPAAGDRIGRFVVEGVLGEGGMGVVVAAHDPDLDRRVALKLLSSRAWGGSDEGAATGRERLVREARALARLTHPNVLPVYEVGTIDDQVFLATELAAGGTLRAWCDAAPRTWEEVTARYLAAGQGLVAAHAAGLVHRDFKPDNILLTADGQVRVADFGLVGVVATGVPELTGELTTSSSRLTQAGALVGTPAYAAPEQLSGEVVGARADQFAFCVAMWEALYGERPFRGRTLAALLHAMSEGPRPPPADREVPARIRAALERGLAVEAGARWPSMTALLAALAPPPRNHAARVALVAAAAAVLAGVGVGVAASQLRRGGDGCASAGDGLARVWSDARRGAVRAAFGATKRPGADATADRALGALDRWSTAWVTARVDTCRAPAAPVQRVRCLDRQLAGLGALAALFEHADGDVVDHAVSAAALLPAPDGCREPGQIDARPLPADPQTRAALDALRARLADARALGDGGKFAEGAAAADALVTDADALGDLPVRATAMALRGWLEHLAGEPVLSESTLRDAARAAAQSHDDALLAEVWTDLLFVVTTDQRRLADAPALESVAEIAAERAPADPSRDADRAAVIGTVRIAQRRWSDARASLERAVTLRRAVSGDDDPRLALVMGDLAIALEGAGAMDDARRVLDDALALEERVLGPDHPNVAELLDIRSTLEVQAGKLEAAEASSRRATAISERALGVDHTKVAASLSNLGIILHARGDHAGAEEVLRRALSLREHALGKDHLDLAIVLTNLGSLLFDLGRADEARAVLERGLAIREHALPADHPDIAVSLNALAAVLASSGDLTAARASFERVVEIRERAYGPDHPDLALPLYNLGLVALAEDRLDESRRLLERAASLLERAYGPVSRELADVRAAQGDLADERHDLAAAAAAYDAAATIAAAIPGLDAEVTRTYREAADDASKRARRHR